MRVEVEVKVDADLSRLRILASVGWLAEESVEFQARVAALGSWITLRAGRSIYEAGEEAMAVYGLGDGLLDISIPVGETEDVLLHRAPPGFWIGDGAILTGKKRVISVRTVVDCRLFVLPGAALQRNLDRNPGDWVSLHRLSARNATVAVTVLGELLALPPRQRFARLLLRCALPDGTVRATQEDLGRMMGMSRMAFRRAFREFIAQGVVRTDYGAVRIADADRLAEIARLTAPP